MEDGFFLVVVSQFLIDELEGVWQRPRLRKKINPSEAEELLAQLTYRCEWIEPTTIPPRCRDPKDHPVLSTAIDGKVDAILTGDADFRADDGLRVEMLNFGIALWGVDTLFEHLDEF